MALRVFVWVWVTGPACWLLASVELEVEPATFGAPAHAPRIRSDRDDDDLTVGAVPFDTGRADHDIGGQVQHALERVG